jgi:hypothetical protein
LKPVGTRDRAVQDLSTVFKAHRDRGDHRGK